jgi:uncharacterized protein YkwD
MNANQRLAMKLLLSLLLVLATSSVPARAEDIVDMISRYRAEHGLSAVKTDPELTALAERQAKAMAALGVMDHDVAGSFVSRMSGVRARGAAENIAAGYKTWAETFQGWQHSPGHNANLLLPRANSVGVAFARNEAARYQTFWAMVIAEKVVAPKKKGRKVAAEEMQERGGLRSAPTAPGRITPEWHVWPFSLGSAPSD